MKLAFQKVFRDIPINFHNVVQSVALIIHWVSKILNEGHESLHVNDLVANSLFIDSNTYETDL